MAKTYKLENILDLKSYMKIAIDEKVEKDADGKDRREIKFKLSKI